MKRSGLKKKKEIAISMFIIYESTTNEEGEEKVDSF